MRKMSDVEFNKESSSGSLVCIYEEDEPQRKLFNIDKVQQVTDNREQEKLEEGAFSAPVILIEPGIGNYGKQTEFFIFEENEQFYDNEEQSGKPNFPLDENRDKYQVTLEVATFPGQVILVELEGGITLENIEIYQEPDEFFSEEDEQFDRNQEMENYPFYNSVFMPYNMMLPEDYVEQPMQINMEQMQCVYLDPDIEIINVVPY